MTRPPLLVVLFAHDGTHAAEVGFRVALCGAVGATVFQQVTNSFDVTCQRCIPLVHTALGLSDPGNVQTVVVEEVL